MHSLCLDRCRRVVLSLCSPLLGSVNACMRAEYTVLLYSSAGAGVLRGVGV